MRVLLINPPDFHLIKTNFPKALEGEEKTGYHPPLGLLYVAAYALEHTDWIIEVLDAQVEELTYEQIRKEIADRNPDIVGIQAMTFTFIDVWKIAQLAKAVSSNIRVVLGGPHVNIFPLESIQLREVDFLVLGEGEIPFSDLLRCLQRGENLAQVKGIVFKENGRVIQTERRPFISNLDSLPFPARKLLPYKRYWSILSRRNPITTFMTSRGCPYKCLFCDRPHLGKIFRSRSAKNVVEELEVCQSLGIQEVTFYDDTFSINRQRVMDICQEIKKRGIKIYWDVRARVDSVDKEMLKAMKAAGCERIHFGVESGNAAILKILNKGITPDQVVRAFQGARSAGITTLGYFMLGNPGESREQMAETVQFAKTLKPDYVHISLATPFPATELYRLGLQKGILKSDYWEAFAKNPTPDFNPPFWEENYSEKELMEILIDAYRNFYLRPQYIFRQILRIRSLREFQRKAKLALSFIYKT